MTRPQCSDFHRLPRGEYRPRRRFRPSPRDLLLGILSLVILLALWRERPEVGGETSPGWHPSGPEVVARSESPGDVSPPGRLGAGLLDPVAAFLAARPAAVSETLGEGDYLFLPNRHSVWVINERSGRFANFNVRDIGEREIKISRRMTLEQRMFPPSDTDFKLSDRELTDVLWVCNRASGVVQLYEPQIEGDVELQGTARPDLGDGEHLFLPHRRTLWVINRGTGAFVTLHFRETQEREIVSSKVATIDLRDFPPESSTYQLSAKNFQAVLWVCNKTSGDVQIWHPQPNGVVKPLPHLVTSTILMKPRREKR